MKAMLVSISMLLMAQFSMAEPLSAEQSAALKKQIEVAKAWAAEPLVVAAVKAANTTPPADYKDMTNDKWKELAVLDAKVRFFSKNAAVEALKVKKSDAVSEIFVNAADGTKVAFLNKTTSWSHKGKPKHDEPMAGKIWEGKVEVDDSTGSQQVQVGLPVLEGGKAIGSMVVGFSVSKLK